MAQISTCPPLIRESVIEAHELIKDHVHYTPVMTNRTLNRLASTPRESALAGDRKPANSTMRLHFKCENLQRIGAFKARGAFHAIERLKQEPGWIEDGGKEKGVVGFSAGNHAQALALAAQENGILAHIVMPSNTRPNKIEATKGYGANVVICQPGEREAVAARIVADKGARLIPPYDHPDVILGQGTIGLELQDQVPPLDAIIAGCSGGGMLSGIALSCEGTRVKVFGAEPEFEGADDGRRGYYSGERVTQVKTRTIADGLIGVVGERPWDIIYKRKLVSGMYAVSEDEIREATKLVLERLKLWIEPSSAVPLAVALFNEEFRTMVEKTAGGKGWDLGLVLSGGNISVDGLVQLFS
ncbi:hypothetical protein KAF25_006893 [Fusarium avenaceum]|uniref:Tryptophan synthase beta chain-like PALP domain-containing protein n=1 Tax=Fusarium avenaceum TaxID=40199 RepID=A0A9P7GXX7_9HYPO|nr:hypothetical protein KAF25_006893 [Fusarium avenaceum]